MFPRHVPVVAVIAALLSVACGASETRAEPRLVSGSPLAVRSASGLATGTVEAEGGRVAQGPNALRVQFDSETVTLVRVSAFMPVHGHAAPEPSITGAAPAYRVTNLVFTMPGLWDVTLDVAAGAQTDTVEFSVDVP